MMKGTVSRIRVPMRHLAFSLPASFSLYRFWLNPELSNVFSSSSGRRLLTMKRLWRISDVARPFCVHRSDSNQLRPHMFTVTGHSSHIFTSDPSSSSNFSYYSTCSSCSPPPPPPNSVPLESFIDLFIDKLSSFQNDYWETREKVSALRDKLVRAAGDSEQIAGVLKENGEPLLRRYPDGMAFMELLKELHPWPRLSLEVSEQLQLLSSCSIC